MFKNPSSSNLIELNGEYSIPIVVLSIIMSVIASYTALSMNERAYKNSFFHRNFWLALASIAMGFGIWSMHFIGMSAYSLPVEMHYHKPLTIISVIPAMLASFIAFYIASRSNRTYWTYVLAGSVMGIGISSMHYLGMYAMEMDLFYTYDSVLFLTSIIIAIIVSVIAIYIFSGFRRFVVNRIIQLVTAIIMGLAVSSMHYTGMAAITFYVPKDFISSSMHMHMMDMSGVAISVAIGMIVLLGTLLFSSLVDRYVEYRANYFDVLTKLPNRRLFEQKLRKPIFPEHLAIWHLHDLEKVNREYDYQFGDELIQHVAEVLELSTSKMVDLYRIEGNRFAFLTRDMYEEKQMQEEMEKVAELLRQPFFIQNQEVTLQATCAISKAYNYEEASSIYTNALSVLNHPSVQYNHEVVMYDPSIHTYTFEREIADDVFDAMLKGELYLVYQPKVSMQTNEIMGVETLLRWNHPVYGMLSPGIFIPILENHDRMKDVTDWIIKLVCRQISIWNVEGIPFGQVAINIPGQYVTSPRLLDVLKQTLNDYDIRPAQLELEITETTFVKNIAEAMRAVSVLRQEGFSVALDDFGTGVSSLSYLKQMPISTLKIDKSFIDEIPHSQKDSSIIQAIIRLGESLDLAVVFEGVETKEQVEFLVATCKDPIIQGYYFSKPMIPEELKGWRNKDVE
ncbi:bifunctional diguanylate cyclase/phosphodiesterase [Psychrobacillus lasiicapitis]|uniref:EAL domain-containing protein n=1 Tax=Psychrobacillus lasiicapitis TaxID=1636719 RepID=A0A544T6S8_9BACI|nr:EAL domain-containing protein [Psychrobacillus lasiicapitis]TQR13147.1 EAL domain-containing protein [Psychrobacillus lasiicapitis]GGA34118.1 bifunctional diguanylate cyclase/phosphodiesterase [Psychrobacillus lasiicapitis]